MLVKLINVCARMGAPHCPDRQPQAESQNLPFLRLFKSQSVRVKKKSSRSPGKTLSRDLMTTLAQFHFSLCWQCVRVHAACGCTSFFFERFLT